MVTFVKDTIGGDINGFCSHFQAVPGCGLRCNVSHIEHMLDVAKNSQKVISFNKQTRYFKSYYDKMYVIIKPF